MQVYGVLDSNDCHIDISLSLKGTKRVATRNGYKFVSVRNEYHVRVLFEKVGNKWQPYE